MVLEYKLKQEDFVTYQLFVASKSNRIIRKRQKNKLFVSLTYLLLGMLLLIQNRTGAGIGFISIGILWYLIYPIWERRRYFKHYQGHVSENYKDRLDRQVLIRLNNEQIEIEEEGTESKISTREIEQINELPTLILLRLKSGHSLIIPKKRLENLDDIQSKLRSMANELNVQYIAENNWSWK